MTSSLGTDHRNKKKTKFFVVIFFWKAVHDDQPFRGTQIIEAAASLDFFTA
jgi:hypothetical protein